MPERISPASVLAHVEVGVVVLDRTATILFANPRALVLLGSTEREMLGSSSFDPRWQAVTPDGVSIPAEQHPVVQAIRTSQPVRDTVLGFRKGSGERVWLQITAIPTVDATGTVDAVYATFTDVSRGQAHQNRLTSTYEATVRSMAEGVTIQGRDGKMLSANRPPNGYSACPLPNCRGASHWMQIGNCCAPTARRCRPRKSRRHTRAAPASRAATRAYWCIGQTASARGCRWRPIC
jgi:PAS domain S-box-containing protein